MQRILCSALIQKRLIKLRWYAPKSPKPFTNLVELHQYACSTYANKNMFGVRDGQAFKWIKYGEFGQMVDNVRGGLAAEGVKQGDAVAVIANNRIEWAAVAYAAHGLGAHMVPMYEVQKPSEWEFIVKDSGSVVLFVAHKNLIPVGEAWLKSKSSPSLRKVFCFEKGSPEANCFQKFMETGKQKPVKAVQPSSDTLAAMIYTSGTTGVPKGVELTHENIASNVNGIHAVLKGSYTDDDTLLSFLPWAHVYGQTAELHHFISMGASLAIASSAQHVLEELPMVKPNVLVSVPTIFNRIHASIVVTMANSPPIKQFLFKKAMDAATQRRKEMEKSPVGTLNPPVPFLVQKKYDFYDKLIFSKIREKLGGRIKFSISGGAALHKQVQNFFNDIGIGLIEGYGLTETSPVIAIGNFCPTVNLQGGMDFFPGTTLEIMDPDSGKFLPRGEEGEIVATGPNVMKQYHNLPEATSEAIFVRDGKRYFKTGDMGVISPQGKLRITGRVKELYKLENGKWVAPVPTENNLLLVPYLHQAMLVGANRPHNVLLVTLNQDNIKKQLNTTNVDFNDAKVVSLVVDGIQKQLSNGKIKKYEAPRRLMILSEELSVSNGMLTPKMSMKRPVIMKKYEKEIEDLYAGQAGHAIQLAKDMKD